MDSTIISASIAAVVSLLVATVTIYGSRGSERRKLNDAIKNQEIQNRIHALHSSIQLVQKIKNELRKAIDLIAIAVNTNNLTIKEDLAEIKESIKLLDENFEDVYANGISSLTKEEGRILHDLKGQLAGLHECFSMIRMFIDGDRNRVKEGLEELRKFREQLTKMQGDYKRLRGRIIRGENDSKPWY